MTYFRRLSQAKDGVVAVLQAKGIDSRYLNFGGEGQLPDRAPTVPTDARSEFLANRAMGDWAEKILAASLRASCDEWGVTHYGNQETMAAGEPGFRLFYLSALEEVRKYGKRPDLLVFPKRAGIPEDISGESFEKIDPLVKQAIGAMEVRSSKLEALTYIRVRQKDREARRGSLSAREVPSFTVKVEDLKIVYRWIEHHEKPQVYAQVFFDNVFMINVLRIFQVVGSGSGFVIENPAKSQEKATIMIPITCGEEVGKFDRLPTFKVAERVTRLGRHDAYVVPVGGDLRISCGQIRDLLLA